ncbi:GNAT family N-acetyltransferase [Umezawaea tangerina]|uniref:RimJ/RimL family protein N-acetyltransferase n=1 Tax=Umezawaea tangerina TaxID=84725 RepID=A0A2T0T6L5_9PSEU|nr:GNAT family protein [Umezawaea tangerina]PRY41290.1 RimJ/RimL family protein N-acetyltransferase [Umezawaea tangerina]
MTSPLRPTDIRLVGDRLVLREFADTDLDAVHSFAADPLVTRYTDFGPNSLDDTRAFLAEATSQVTTPGRTHFALAATLADSGELIGSVAIGVTSARHRQGEFGFVFHRGFWSRGYATETGALLLRFGFDHLRLRRVSATCHPDNHASARVLEKVGLRFEGRMRSHLFVRGSWRDSLLYAAVDDDGGVGLERGRTG